MDTRLVQFSICFVVDTFHDFYVGQIKQLMIQLGNSFCGTFFILANLKLFNALHAARLYNTTIHRVLCLTTSKLYFMSYYFNRFSFRSLSTSVTGPCPSPMFPRATASGPCSSLTPPRRPPTFRSGSWPPARHSCPSCASSRLAPQAPTTAPTESASTTTSSATVKTTAGITPMRYSTFVIQKIVAFHNSVSWMIVGVVGFVR